METVDDITELDAGLFEELIKLVELTGDHDKLLFCGGVAVVVFHSGKFCGRLVADGHVFCGGAMGVDTEKIL